MFSSGLTRRRLRQAIAPVTALVMLLFVPAALADTQTSGPKPKFGAHATPIHEARDYFRKNDAPDYWALSPYYVPQATGSACSLATVATMVNALRGLPPHSTDAIVSQSSLLEAVGSPEWAQRTAQDGDGVTFEEFVRYVSLGLKAFRLDADIEVFKPDDSSALTVDRLRRLLADNERSAGDIVLVYCNQGVVTGDWDRPHLSPLGGYDAERRQVLIMDVDRQFYIPYWTSEAKLLEAMLRPAPADQGILAGETGGLVRVTLRRPAD